MVGVCVWGQLYVWVQYMGHFLYTEYKLRASPRKHKYTTRQKLFLAAIGSCHVGAFLVFMPAVDKIGVALYQIIYSSGTSSAAVQQPQLTPPSWVVLHRVLRRLLRAAEDFGGGMAVQGWC